MAITSVAPINILRIANNHATGTQVVGAATAAVTDIKLVTPSANGGQTMVAGCSNYDSRSKPEETGTSTTGTNKYQTVATINYTGTEAVTEWGLFGNLGAIGGTALSSATGSPLHQVLLQLVLRQVD